MKKILFVLVGCLAMTMASCSNGSATANEKSNDTTSVDSSSVADSAAAVADTLTADSAVVSD